MSMCTDRCPDCGERVRLFGNIIGDYGYCPCGWKHPKEYAAFTARRALIRATRRLGGDISQALRVPITIH